MKRFLTMCAGILLICQFTPPLTLAQNAGYEVKGVVVDKSGMPILGATVVEKGTTNGVSTGIDGDYAIRAAGPESVIEVSYVGYKTVSLVASSSLLAHLTLEEDAMGIDDVVVIGYGSVKKNDMTGSVVAIKAEEFNRGAVVSTQDMLKGKVPGVHIIPGDGGPGSSATIRVRGAASLNASNDPLIVIDGVPIAVDGGKGMANPLETINPNDIESFTVLKDASAAAIYGSRASNGVILVTTKKGRGNTPRVSYSGSVSVQTNSDELPVMSPGEFRTYIDQVYPAGTTTGDKVQSMLGDKNTNWQDLVFRTAISHDHNVSLIGNINDRMPYRASVGYTNQQGTLETSEIRTRDARPEPLAQLLRQAPHGQPQRQGRRHVAALRFGRRGGFGGLLQPHDRPLFPQRRRLDRLHRPPTDTGTTDRAAARTSRPTPCWVRARSRSSTTATIRRVPSVSSATPRSTIRFTASKRCVSTSTSASTYRAPRPTTA